MKLGWLFTDEAGDITFHTHYNEYWKWAGSYIRIAYFPIEEGSSHTDSVPE